MILLIPVHHQKSTCSQNACLNQLVDLCCQWRVAHNLLHCLRVLLQVSKSIPHLRSLQNLLNFRVSHGPSSSLLLVTLIVAHIDGRLGLCDSFLAEFVLGVFLQSCFIGLEGFVVFFEEVMTISFLVVGFLEVGIFFQSFLIVLFSSLEIHEFN